MGVIHLVRTQFFKKLTIYTLWYLHAREIALAVNNQ